MAYVDEAIKNEFETLPLELKNEILGRDIALHSMTDLIHVLEMIASED